VKEEGARKEEGVETAEDAEKEGVVEKEEVAEIGFEQVVVGGTSTDLRVRLKRPNQLQTLPTQKNQPRLRMEALLLLLVPQYRHLPTPADGKCLLVEWAEGSLSRRHQRYNRKRTKKHNHHNTINMKHFQK